jgi:DNA repair exonuclease SbcCD ATPase subunit
VELPPLRFVKETSTSGNLLMEAVVVDVSENFFTPEEQDLRTEADVEEIYSITDETGQLVSSVTSEKLKIDVTSSSGEAPKRPPRKSDSQKSNSYYSLTKNLSLQSDAGEESLAVVADLDTESYGEYESAISSEKIQDQDRAFQVAAITETTSLPGDDIESRRPLTPRTTHEIGSDLRVNRSESQELNRTSRRRSSQSSDEVSKDGLMKRSPKKTKSLDMPDDYQRDIQGEEGDGLVIDPEVNAAKQLELKKEELQIIDELKLSISEIQQGLLSVEEELFVQTTLKSTSATAKQSLETLNSILQPYRDIQTVLQTIVQEERKAEISAVELIAPPIFELQKSLAVVEKCIEMQGKEHTLIQKTCANILDTTGLQLQKSLELIEAITLLEKELDSTKISGRMTPSKIIQEVCITIREIETGLQNADDMLQNKHAESSQKSQEQELSKGESSTETLKKDLDLLSNIANVAQTLQVAFSNVKVYEESDPRFKGVPKNILEVISEPTKNLVKEVSHISKLSIRHAAEKSLEQEIRLALIDRLSHPVGELVNTLDEIKKREPPDFRFAEIDEKRLSISDSIDKVIKSIDVIRGKIKPGTVFSQSAVEVTSQDIVKDVFDQVSQIVLSNITQSIEDLLFNIESAQKLVGDTVILEALRQVSTLQKDLATTIIKVSQIKTEPTLNAIESIAQPIEVLNSQISEITPATSREILDDLIASLNILEESIIVDEERLETIDLCIPFSILRGRTCEVRENICGLTEHGTVPESLSEDSKEGSVVVILEESSETVIPAALLDDTRQAISCLQNEAKNISSDLAVPLMNCLRNLLEVTGESIFEKKKEELSLDERMALQNYVAPLEQIEDALIEAQDILNAQPGISREDDRIRLILEHIQYNVAVMHQQILDEVVFLDQLQQSPKYNLDDLKRCIANILTLPIMQDTPGSEFVFSAAVGRAVIENVRELEKSLAVLYQGTIVEGVENIEPELYQTASEVVECVEKLTNRPLFVESGESAVTSEDLTEIKKLSEPLRKLGDSVSNIQQFEEEKKRVFGQLRLPLLAINDIILDVKHGEFQKHIAPLEETVGDALEVLTIEQSRGDITPNDLEPLNSLEQVLINIKNSIGGVDKQPIALEELNVSLAKLSGTLIVLSKNSGLKYILKSLRFFVEAFEAALISVTPSVTEKSAASKKEKPEEVVTKQFSEAIKNLMDVDGKKIVKDRKLLSDELHHTLPVLRDNVQNVSVDEHEQQAITEASGVVTLIFNYLNNIENVTTENLLESVLQANEALKKNKSNKEFMKNIRVLYFKTANNLRTIKKDADIKKEIELQHIQMVSDSVQGFAKHIAAIKYSDIDKEKILNLQKSLYPLQTAVNDLSELELTENDLKFLENIAKILSDLDNFVSSKLTITEETLSKELPRKEDILILLNILNQAVKSVEENSPIRRITHLLNSLTENMPDVAQQLQTAFTKEVKTEIINKTLLTPLKQIKESLCQTPQQADLKQGLEGIEENLTRFSQVCQSDMTENEVKYAENIKLYVGELKSIDEMTEEKDLATLKQKEVDLASLESSVDSPHLKILSQTVLATGKEIQAEIEKQKVHRVEQSVKPLQELVAPIKEMHSHLETLQNIDLPEAKEKIKAVIVEVQNLEPSILEATILTPAEAQVINAEKELMVELNDYILTQVIEPKYEEVAFDNLINKVESLKATIPAENKKCLEICKVMETAVHQIGEIVDLRKTAESAKITKPIVESLEILKGSIVKIEEQTVAAEKKAAVTELQKSVEAIESMIDTNLKHVSVNFGTEEKIVVDAANKTLSELNNFMTPEKEEKATVESVKAAIEGLRLAVVVIPKESKIKETMECLEDTAKNVINLMEKIPAKLETKVKTIHLIKGIEEKVKSMDKSQLPKDKQDMLKKIGVTTNKLVELLQVIKVENEAEEDAVMLIHNLLKELENSLNSNKINVEEVKANLNSFKCSLNKAPKNSSLLEFPEPLEFLVDQVEKFLEEKTEEPVSCVPLTILEDNLQSLQEAVATAEPKPEDKVSKILITELQRPLTTLQFVSGSILEERKAKLTQDDLNHITITSEAVQDLCKTIDSLEGTEINKVEILEREAEKLKVLLASINLESQIKDLIEPLQDVQNSVKKALEKAIIKQQEDAMQKHQVVSKLGKSLEKFEICVGKLVEDKPTNSSLAVLKELESPLKAMIEAMNTVESTTLTNNELTKLTALNASLEQVADVESDITQILPVLHENITAMIVPQQETVEMNVPTSDQTFLQSIIQPLERLEKAVGITQTIFEKPKTIKDVTPLHKINISIVNLLKFTTMVKNLPKGNLKLLGKLANPIYDLQQQISKCVEAKLLQEELPILNTIEASLEAISTIAQRFDNLEETDIKEFSNTLDSLQNTLISVCNKAVLIEVPEGQESILQKLLQPLENVAKATINIQTELSNRSALNNVLHKVLTQCENVNSKLSNSDLKVLATPMVSVIDKIKSKEYESDQAVLEDLKPDLKDIQTAVLAQSAATEPVTECLTNLQHVCQSILETDQDNLNLKNVTDLLKSLEMLSIAVGAESQSSDNSLQALPPFKEPLTQIQHDVSLLKSKIESCPEPKSGIISLVEIDQPLEDLKQGLQKSEEMIAESSEELVARQETFERIKEPLQKLAVLMSTVQQNLQSAQVTDVEKQQLKEAMVCFKENIELIKLAPEALSITIINKPLEALTAKIEEAWESVDQTEQIKEAPVEPVQLVEEIMQEEEEESISTSSEPIVNENKTENVAVIQNFEKALSDGRNILKYCISAIRDTQGNLDLISCEELDDGFLFLLESLHNLANLINKDKVKDLNMENLEILNNTMEEFKNLSKKVSSVEQVLNKPELGNYKDELRKSLSKLKNKVEILIKLSSEATSLQLIVEPLKLIVLKIDYIENEFKKLELAKLPITNLIVKPVENLCNEIKELQTQIQILKIVPKQSVLSIIETEGKLSQFMNILAQTEKDCSNTGKNIPNEVTQKLKLVQEPLREVSAVIVNVKNSLTKPQVAEQREVLCKAVAVLKSQFNQLIPTIPQTAGLEVLLQPTQQLIAQLDEIEQTFLEEEKLMVKENTEIVNTVLVPVSNLAKEISSLNTEIENLNIKPKQGVLIVADLKDSIIELSESLNEDDKHSSEFCEEIPEDIKIKINSVQEPLQQLLLTVGTVKAAVSKGNVQEINKSEICEDLKASKCKLEDISKVISQVKFIEKSGGLIQNLSNKIEEVESKIRNEELQVSASVASPPTEKEGERKEIEVIQEVLTPLTHLNEELKTLRADIQNIPAHQAVLGLAEVDKNLLNLLNSLVVLEEQSYEKADTFTSTDLEEIGRLKESLEKLSVVVVEVRSVATKPDLQKQQTPNICEALTMLKCQLDEISQTMSEASVLKTTSVAVTELAGKLSEVKDLFEAEKSTEKEFAAATKIVLQPIEKLAEEIKTLRTSVTDVKSVLQQGVLSMTEIEQDLINLHEALIISEQTSLENIEKIKPEELQQIQALKEPLEKFTTIVTQIKSAMDKPEIQEKEKVKVKHAITALKCELEQISHTVPEAKCLEISFIAVKQLAMKLAQIASVMESEEVPEIKEEKLTDVVLQPIIHLKEELHALQSDVKDATIVPQQSVLKFVEIEQNVVDLQEALTVLEESEKVTAEVVDGIGCLKEQLKQLSTLAVEVRSTVNKPEVLDQKRPKLQKAVQSLKCELSVIAQKVSEAKVLETTSVAVHQLSAKLTEIEKLFEEEKSVQEVSTLKDAVLQPMTTLAEEIKTLKSESKDVKIIPQQAVMKVTELEQDLINLHEALVSSEQLPFDQAQDVSREAFEQIQILKEPLQLLSTTVVELRSAINKPEIQEQQKPKIQQALTALKCELDKVSQAIPDAKSLETSSVAIKQLSAKLSEIENLIESEQVPEEPKVISIILQPIFNLSSEIKALQADTTSIKLDSQRGVLSVVEIEKDLLDLQNALAESEKNSSEEMSVLDAVQELQMLKEPLEALSSVVVEVRSALNKPEITEQQKPKVCKALAALKCELDKVAQSIPEITPLETAVNAVKQLSAKLSVVEEIIKTEEKPVQEGPESKQVILQPVTNLIQEINTLRAESSKAALVPQQAVLSVVEMEHQLVTLQETLTTSLEQGDDIKQQMENLKEPLEKLSAVVVEMRCTINKPEIEEQKPKVGKAIATLKCELDKVSQTIPETKRLETSSVAIKQLSAKLSEIENLIE